MSARLKVLIVEDWPADVELALRELRAARLDPEWRTVDSEEGYVASLDSAPDLILDMSGYTGEVIRYNEPLGPGLFLLQKPFTPEMLARKVREVLDNPGPG